MAVAVTLPNGQTKIIPTGQSTDTTCPADAWIVVRDAQGHRIAAVSVHGVVVEQTP